MKRVSLDVIAKDAGVSKTTASMVLNGKGSLNKIHPDTQARIFQVARKYRYRPNLLAKNLSEGKTMTLGLIVPNISDSYYSTIADHLESLASKAGYILLLGSTGENPEKERELLLTFEAQRVDGILIASTQHNLEDISLLYQNGLPIVLFDRHYPGTNLPSVVIDNYWGIKKLVDYMHSMGRKKVGYIGLDLDLNAIHERQRGFKESVKSIYGSDVNLLQIVAYREYAKTCYEATMSLVEQGVDAIIFETHYLALHGIRKLNELSLKYPDQISIASYGDHEVFTIFKPYVTAIDQPVGEIALASLELLQGIMSKQATGNVYHMIQPKLIVRHS